MIDPSQAWALSVRILAAGMLLSTLELWSSRRLFDDGGLLARRLLLLRFSWVQAPRVKPVLMTACHPGVLSTCLVLRAATCLLLAAAPFSLTALLVMFALNSYLGFRAPVGRDGADQLTSVMLTTFVLARAAGSSGAMVLGEAFVGAQVALAYCVAGVAKAVERKWWDGTYLRGIMASESYGHRSVADLLRAHPGVSLLASVGVIAFEVGFPLAALGPRETVAGILAIGVFFHFANAVVMGLNNFLVVFVSAYPCVLVLNEQAHRLFLGAS
jgi:hypothetical protein